MKEATLPQEDKIEIVDQKQIEKRQELFGSIKPEKGHTLYKINATTMEVTEAQYELQDIHFYKAKKGDLSIHKKVVIEEGFTYISALNKKNALKKLNKQLTQLLTFKID